MKKYKYLIIGNSAAAVGCIEGIREVDKSGSVCVVSIENEHTYSRPLISYLLCGKTSRERMKYRSDEFYSQNSVECLLGKTVTKIDEKAHSVLCDGEEIFYEKLLVSTGSSPFVPPMKGLDEVEDKFTFMSLSDAEALETKLNKNAKVLVIGAGLIGLKCVEGIYGRVGSITVVDLANRILPSILDEDGSAIVQKYLEDKGVTFLLSNSVDEFYGNSATLKNGEKVDFDLLVVAVGVRANTSLVKDAGGEIVRGITTDLFCKTTLDDVYAAGDCSESYDSIMGSNRVLALLPNAYMQGECAGINMAGGEKKYDFAIAMNAIGFFDLHIITAGCYDGEKIVTADPQSNSYRAFFIKDNLLCGFILVGDVLRAGIYTSLIRNKTPLTTVDFDTIKNSPQLIAINHAGGQHL